MAQAIPNPAVRQFDRAELLRAGSGALAEELVLYRGSERTVVVLPKISHDALGVDTSGNVLMAVGACIICLAHVNASNLPPFPTV